MTIAHNIETIRRDLPASVKLMAVSKQVSVAQMREAYAAGIRDFGESRIQEAQAKQQELSDLSDICWHLIGHLQGNKVRKAVQIFDWIHSVDSLKLLHQIDRVAGELSKSPRICLQVKILPDPDKYGWTIPELIADLTQINCCEFIKISGLMAIPPLGLTIEQTQELFDNARDLSHQISQQPGLQLQMTELSMGMSGDYRSAIAAGTTIIRLGSIIFGDRTEN
ncbi:YggS family pyridoxal phosphate-dependent enzyme [Chamaesiphon minutus]|uniref:Pyridoxal phosphate homeostasis protein n=1 Tax=Chamaesiphon minutus (strain ATCC 27169 / PCC 6605) TaxID=1173020 RepID=K9UNK6_CHAP6|nr:YggS family pyridoxal phosphate-dependent enzyme [Chamaesiphon minutus]AFY96395.1 pyridoxal phosphate enzyme, YggS family [Chamaesiphon minutus PCC 6605]